MGWFDKLIYGVDLDEEQARQDNLDRQLAAQNQADLNNGTYDQETFDAAERNRRESYIGNVEAQVGEAFAEGWNEGASNIRNGTGSVVGTLISTPFKLIPWQLWLIGLLYLAWNFGLLKKFIPFKR